MAKKNRHEGSSLDSMFAKLGELQDVQEIAFRKMPPLSRAEKARRNAEAERDVRAGVGIPLDEAFAWLHDQVDGVRRPKPKARKRSP